MYDLNIAEEELKNKVAMDFFGDFDTTERPNNIDFVVAQKIRTHAKQSIKRKAISTLGGSKAWQ